MKRFVLFGCLAYTAATLIFAPSAMAISAFNKQWKADYLGEDAPEDLKAAGKKAGCYVCHVKGEKKTVRNEYGDAVHKLLKKEDFSKEYLKEKPEEAAEKMTEGFKKAGEAKSSDGKAFAAKIAAGELPATNAGLDD